MTPFSVINTKIKTRSKVNFLERFPAGVSLFVCDFLSPTKNHANSACATNTKQHFLNHSLPTIYG